MSSATASDWSDDCDATGCATGGAAPDTANAPTVAPIQATAITAASHMGFLDGLATASACELTRGSCGGNGGSSAVKGSIGARVGASIAATMRCNALVVATLSSIVPEVSIFSTLGVATIGASAIAATALNALMLDESSLGRLALIGALVKTSELAKSGLGTWGSATSTLVIVAAPSVGSEVIGASIVGIVSLMSEAAASPD